MSMLKIKLLILALIIAAAGYLVYNNNHKNLDNVAAAAKNAGSSAQKAASTAQNTADKVQAAKACSANKLAQNIIVSIKAQHLWACHGPLVKYDSPVVTGMELYAADLTPVGTYQISSKLTNQTLAGSDATGSWSDPVKYWEPFLYNKYGTYGFHDATWRANSDFGKVDINAPYTAKTHGSHGCVELPLATAKWLYNWSRVGTTVTIES